MITIKNVRTLYAEAEEIQIASFLERSLDVKGQLLLLPALIDPHLSLGSPSQDNWAFGVESAVRGGISTILDIPSPDSPSASKQELKEKKESVGKQLEDLKMPIHYFPYVKANSHYIEELGSQKNLTKGSLLLFTKEDSLLEERMWDRIFQIAAWEDLPIIINSNNENQWQQAGFKSSDETLLEKAIYYAEKQNARLYVLNVATQNELNLIQEGRSRSLLIYAETTPQHLFPLESSKADCLWEALNQGIIETIGSGYHVERQGQEKVLWHEAHFDFLNPIFFFPLMLTAYHEGKISLENIVRLTRVNFYDIFELERKDENFVLIDLEKEQVIQRIDQTGPIDLKLKGWPEYIVLRGLLFKSEIGAYHLTRME